MGGYTPAELATAQDRYGLSFPPDLVETMLKFRPSPDFDWSIEDPRIRTMLDWPFEMLKSDVTESEIWWPRWGDRPATMIDRVEILRAALAKAPRLIPIHSHRFLPETPNDAGNPVFSMYGFDTIYYGANLTEYFENEGSGRHVVGPVRHILFWSEISENHDLTFYGSGGQEIGEQ